MNAIEFPEMRGYVRSALESLSDFDHQQRCWGVYDPGGAFYDDLTLNVNILYDDCAVLPHPGATVGTVLYTWEVGAFESLEASLGPLLDRMGDRVDLDYIRSDCWPGVLQAARGALETMRLSDENCGKDANGHV